jgi:hypothetical protein
MNAVIVQFLAAFNRLCVNRSISSYMLITGPLYKGVGLFQSPLREQDYFHLEDRP